MVNKNKSLLIDTGFFIALANKNDQYHKKAVQLVDKLPEVKWITTWPVLTEVCHIFQSRCPQIVDRFLSNFEESSFEIFPLRSEHMTRIKVLLKKYADVPMDLADASLVLAAEELDHGNIVSTDRKDFKMYKWNIRKSFHNFF